MKLKSTAAKRARSWFYAKAKEGNETVAQQPALYHDRFVSGGYDNSDAGSSAQTSTIFDKYGNIMRSDEDEDE